MLQLVFAAKTVKEAIEMAAKNEKEIIIGEGVRFERIRRITGYLVGTLDNFNDAKLAEVKDRVKHSTGTGQGVMERV